MIEIIKKVIEKISPFAFLDPEGPKGIEKRGHRGYVGGMWDEIGTLQFNFLVSKGLNPDSILLDIACGSLRLGVKAIPYLKVGNYLGIEKETELVKAGLEKELEKNLVTFKKPKIVISDSFEFEKFEKKADFAIAQSLFTHLPPNLINNCFEKLYPSLKEDGVFFATYFQSEKKINNPKKPHAHGYFGYTKKEILDFGENNGFKSNYIGEWNHPRKQIVVEYKK